MACCAHSVHYIQDPCFMVVVVGGCRFLCGSSRNLAGSTLAADAKGVVQAGTTVLGQAPLAIDSWACNCPSHYRFSLRFGDPNTARVL